MTGQSEEWAFVDQQQRDLNASYAADMISKFEWVTACEKLHDMRVSLALLAAIAADPEGIFVDRAGNILHGHHWAADAARLGVPVKLTLVEARPPRVTPDTLPPDTLST